MGNKSRRPSAGSESFGRIRRTVRSYLVFGVYSDYSVISEPIVVRFSLRFSLRSVFLYVDFESLLFILILSTYFSSLSILTLDFLICYRYLFLYYVNK